MNEEEAARFLLSLDNDLRESRRQLELLNARRSDFARRLDQAARHLRDTIRSDALSKLPPFNEIREIDAKYFSEIENQESIQETIEGMRC